MSLLRKILPVILVLILLYGGLLLAEKFSTQELTRVSHPPTQEAVCLMWAPRLLKGDGVCYLNLLNAQGKIVDTAQIRILDTAYNALQQFGQLGFDGSNVTVANLKTGELAPRFVVRDGRLSRQD